jgi:dipeptidyl aminopeptidase/acylaminoacyl peptidase
MTKDCRTRAAHSLKRWKKLMRRIHLLVLASAAVAVVTCPLSAQQKRPITVGDCVTARDLQFDESTFRSTIKISPDGSRAVFPIKSPNLQTNENEIELHVREVPTVPGDKEKPILVGDISAVRWRPDGRHLTALIRENGQRMLEEIDSVTGDHQVLAKADRDIEEYAVSKDGSAVVYGLRVPASTQDDSPTAEDIARGYRIPFQKAASGLRDRETLFVTKRIKTEWATPQRIAIVSPLSNERLTALPYGNAPDLNPTLSPDGRSLLVSYFDFSETMPDEWGKSAGMQHRNTAGIVQAFHLLVLYDLATGETRVPLKTTWSYYAPLWSSDGRSFAVVARPPINSALERDSLRNHTMGSAGAHLFWVEPTTGRIEDVASKLASPWEGPLLWDSSGDFFVRIGSIDSIIRYSRSESGWRPVASWHSPLSLGSQLATNGRYVIGEFSATMNPPELFSYRLGENQVEIFDKLNPQFGSLSFGQPTEVHWKTSAGFDAKGLLLLPPNYVKGNRYPLVIHTKPFTNEFVCSAGNFPSFAPQPMANAGIMYLGQISTSGSAQRQEDYFPKGYPGYQGIGGVAEAAFVMDLWDAAVDHLDQQGLIDRDRVGIIGFSRTGWYTEFILAHSKTHYRAATVADNVQYTLGEYWLLHDAGTIKAWDQTYGGPPYGPTLKNWLDYSISFNIDKIHTPVLMEQMGAGSAYDNVAAPPTFLTVALEVFTGLNRLKKPVELYYYPNEDHTPEHPKARLATMQRNVDWYRFWLQGYERPNPEDPQQYTRWRELRELQRQDEEKMALR